MQDLIGKPLHMDCFDLLVMLPDGCVDLLFLDPPYNIGVFCKMPPGEYLDWCGQWIAEGSRVLKPNGAFWLCHKDPGVLIDLSRMIAERGRKRINWATWDKYNGAPDTPFGIKDTMNCTKLHPQGKRSFDQDAEYLVYHADEGDWTAQCDRERGFIFEPLRAYLDGEKQRAGLTMRQVAEAFQRKTGSRTVTGMAGHWLAKVQWTLPTEENYLWLRQLFNRDNGNEFLRREYEDLRQEFESLRYTFNNPGKVSSVWQIPPAPSNGHPTPKPEALLEQVIETTSNPGDLVLDFFAGSFTSAVVAERLDRRWICCDNDTEWVELGQKRLREVRQLEMRL